MLTFADGPRLVTDGRLGLGPCACPACYVNGCNECASVGCVRHFGDLRVWPAADRVGHDDDEGGEG